MNRFKLTLFPLAIASAFNAGIAHADDFDSRFYIAPLGSYVLADHDRKTHNAYGGELVIGKPINEFIEVEGIGTYLRYRKKTQTTPGTAAIPGIPAIPGVGGLPGVPAVPGVPGIAGTSTSYKATRYEGGGGVNLFPFGASLGYARHFFIHGDADYGKKFVYNAGVGYDLNLSEPYGPSIRAEALYHRESSFVEEQFNLGIRIPFGAVPQQVAAAEAPVTVVPVQAPAPPPPPPPPPPCQAPTPGQPMSLEGCKVGDTLVLRGVNFLFDKSTLTLNAKTILDQVADALNSRTDIKVEIDGHTDGKGSAPYNLRLSDQRAASVRRYFIGKGIAPSRMTSRGYGKTMPIADNSTDEGREINRRVELKVLEANGGAGAIEVAPFTSDGSPVPASTAAPSPIPAAAAGSGAVSIANFAFAPASVTVPVGSTITWTNADSSSHTVNFPTEKSSTLAQGATYTKTFSQPGSYPYQCGIHSSMKGTIIVQ